LVGKVLAMDKKLRDWEKPEKIFIQRLGRWWRPTVENEKEKSKRRGKMLCVVPGYYCVMMWVHKW
jgi:hypothetical protein